MILGKPPLSGAGLLLKDGSGQRGALRMPVARVKRSAGMGVAGPFEAKARLGPARSRLPGCPDAVHGPSSSGYTLER